MTKTQANKIINALFAAIPDIYQGFHLMRDKMESLEKDAEKKHRSNRQSVKGFSIGQAAKYFTVQHLFHGKDAEYSIEAIIDIRYEALLGAAFAKRYAKELAEWFALVESSEFAQIDYSELMS